MQSITFGQCFKGAWRDAVRAVRHMPLLFLGIFLLLLATTYVNEQIQLAAHAAAVADLHAEATRRSFYSLAVSLVTLVLVSIVSVRVIRYSLAVDAARWGDGLRRYLLLCLVFGFAIVVAIVLAAVLIFVIAKLLGVSHLSSPAAPMTIGILASCGLIFVTARLSLLFSHTAIGGRIRWRAAWHDTRGHFWSIFGLGCAILFPVMVLSGIFNFTLGHLISAETARYGILAVVSTMFALLSTATAAACSAWLYRRFAAELLSSSAGPTYASGLD